MTHRTYGQYCGIAKGLEIVGERWALLVVRELLLAPKRYSDLQRGLPRIPTNILSSRLKQLESDGVIARRVLPGTASTAVYELTAHGRELEDILLRLGRWGARSLEPGEDGEVRWIDPTVRALRASFRPHEASELSATLELHCGAFIIQARIENSELDVQEGRASNPPDLIIDFRGSISPLLTGQVSSLDALEQDQIRVTGDIALLDRFVEIFKMPPDGFADRLVRSEGRSNARDE